MGHFNHPSCFQTDKTRHVAQKQKAFKNVLTSGWQGDIILFAGAENTGNEISWTLTTKQF